MFCQPSKTMIAPIVPNNTNISKDFNINESFISSIPKTMDTRIL